MDRAARYLILVLSVLMLAAPARAAETDEAPDIDIKSMLFGHIGDSYSWHITRIAGKDISIPLPVIVKSSTGWHCFLSSRLEDGAVYEGLYISSSDRYDGKVVELDAAGINVPLMIGGATTSNLHVALKIAPVYGGPVVWVKDASQNPIVAAHLLDDAGRASFEASVEAEQAALRRDYQSRQPETLSIDEARERRLNLFDD